MTSTEYELTAEPMRIFALLAGLAVLGALLLADNWSPIRAVLYAVAWLAVAVILIKFARR